MMEVTTTIGDDVQTNVIRETLLHIHSHALINKSICTNIQIRRYTSALAQTFTCADTRAPLNPKCAHQAIHELIARPPKITSNILPIPRFLFSFFLWLPLFFRFYLVIPLVLTHDLLLSSLSVFSSLFFFFYVHLL